MEIRGFTQILPRPSLTQVWGEACFGFKATGTLTAIWAVGTLTTRAEPSRGRRRGCKDRPWASPATTSPGGSCTPTVRQSPAMCLPYRIPPNSQRPERFIDEKTKTRGGKATGPPPPQGTLGNYDTLGCHSWRGG